MATDEDSLLECIATICDEAGYGFTRNEYLRRWDKRLPRRIFSRTTFEYVGSITDYSVEGGSCSPFNELRVSYTIGETDYNFQGNICSQYFTGQLQDFAEEFRTNLLNK